MSDWIPDDDWETIVESVPIPSVDLVVVHDGALLLAKRKNEPAKGEWFVPGGRIRKNESIADAVHRVADEELGVTVSIETRLGAYDHFYDVSDVGDVSKHYVAHGFVVTTDGDQFSLDDQHGDVRLFTSNPGDLHDYVQAYIEDAGIFDSQL